jgi:hypothetical protein
MQSITIRSRSRSLRCVRHHTINPATPGERVRAGGIDVRATMSGTPTFEKRTAGGGSWSTITPAQFA